MEKNNLIKILILKIILFDRIKITFQDTTVQCSPTIECNICELSTINDKPFINYGNLFCKNNLNIKFIEFIKNEYIEHFRKNPEVSNICDEQNFNLNDSEGQKTITLGKSDKNYLSTNSLNCNYEIINSFNNQKYEGYLSIKLSSLSTIDLNNELKFSIYIHFSEFNNYYYKDDNIRNNEKIINFHDYSKLSIFIDIDKNNNESIEENLIINILKREKESKNNNEENFQNKKESNKKDYILFYVLVAAISVLILIISVIIRICMKKKIDGINREITNLNMNTNNNNIRDKENKKKIDLLFQTKLFPIKYSKEFSDKGNINCSICLDNFVENESMISLTPCSHIFHFDCLKKWSENIEESFKCPNCNFDFLSDEEPVLIQVERKKENTNNNNIYNHFDYNDNLSVNNDNFNYLPSLTNRSFNNNTFRSNNNLRFSNINA